MSDELVSTVRDNMAHMGKVVHNLKAVRDRYVAVTKGALRMGKKANKTLRSILKDYKVEVGRELRHWATMRSICGEFIALAEAKKAGTCVNHSTMERFPTLEKYCCARCPTVCYWVCCNRAINFLYEAIRHCTEMMYNETFLADREKLKAHRKQLNGIAKTAALQARIIWGLEIWVEEHNLVGIVTREILK